MNSTRLLVKFLLIFLIISLVNAVVEQRAEDDGTKQESNKNSTSTKAIMKPESEANTPEDDFEEDESYDSSVDDEKALFTSVDSETESDLLKADQDDSETKDVPIKSEEEYTTELEIHDVESKQHQASSSKMESDIKPEIKDPSTSKQTVPIEKPPSWDQFLHFEELYEKNQKKQPFMITKAKPFGTYTYFPALQMKAMKLYKFYEKNIEGKKNVAQKVEDKISQLYKIQPNLDESHLDNKILEELYHQLFKKNIYDFVFYGASVKNHLKAVCPGKTNQKVDIYLKKPTSNISDSDDTVNQSENPSSSTAPLDQSQTPPPPNTISPTGENLSPSPDKDQSSKTPSPSPSFSPKWLYSRSKSQHSPSHDKDQSSKTLSPSPSFSPKWLYSRSKSQRTEQIIPLEKYEKITYEGQVLRTQHTINILHYYWPSLHPCEVELEPAFIHKVNWTDTLAYEAGYLVEFKHKPEKPLNIWGNVMITPENMMWYYLAHFVLDLQTTDTLYALYYIPFYRLLRETIRNLAVYTDYEVNKNVYPEDMKFDKLYSKENQEEIFRKMAKENYKKYYNVDEGLVLERQELIDQKTLPVWSYRRVTMYYMNVAPMYKIVREHSWSKVEEALLNIPITENDGGHGDDQTNNKTQPKTNNEGNEIQPENTEDVIENNTDYAKYKYENPDKLLYDPVVRLVSGTYGELQVEDQPVYLYHKEPSSDTTTKRLRVPYAFYKLIEVEYTSPNVQLINIRNSHLTHHFTIVIITHNNPFEREPEPLCDEKISCKDYGWPNIDQNDPKFGLTYCCKFTDTLMEKLGISHVRSTIKSNRVLNLNTLRNILRSKRSYYSDEVAPEDRIPETTKKEEE